LNIRDELIAPKQIAVSPTNVVAGWEVGIIAVESRKTNTLHIIGGL
jgi:hypothetical protein